MPFKDNRHGNPNIPMKIADKNLNISIISICKYIAGTNIKIQRKKNNIFVIT